MKTRKPKEPVKASNTFQCLTCEGHPLLNGVAPLKEHMKTVHSVTELKGSRKMILHLDCSDSYSSQYEVEIGDIKLTQTTVNPRKFGMLAHGL